MKKSMAQAHEAAQATQAILSLTHKSGCPKVLFMVCFDGSLDLYILALSGKEDTLD